MTGRLKLSTLKDAHKGIPAAILGGGPSLPEDLKRVPAGALLISVNYHGLYYCNPDYMVYNDAPSTNPLMEQAVEKHRTVHVSPEPSSDIEFDVPVWTGFFSSHTALWFADWLGCAPIILCGHDLYQGEAKHCPPSTYHSPMFDYGLDFYLRPWQEDAKNSIQRPENVRAMSGPLTQLFGAY